MMPFPSFLQSSAWEQFQRALGRRIWRIGGALVIRHDLPLGFNYLYCPRASVGSGNGGLGYGFLDAARAIARAEKSIFLKIDPLYPLNPIPHTLYPSYPIQPRETIILDLTQPEERLLAAMHEKTRYNMRLAERKGAGIKDQVSGVMGGEDFEIFWRLLRQTAERDGFRTHERGYYKKLLAARSEDFSNELFFAEYRGETIAAALVNFYRGETSIGGTVTYLHGASAREQREVMAPHLLHWRIMQDAKRRGCVSYDLWGIDERRWPGITRFKRGFGGREILYPQSIDVVYRPARYRGYRLWRKFWEK